MKQLLLLFTILSMPIIAQDSVYVFSKIYDYPTNPVEDQNRSGTCWSFSSLSFIESEIIKKEGSAVDLSEMFVVRKCYEYKAEKYVRMHGETNFGGGGAFHDSFWTLENYGIVPETIYTGLQYGEKNHVHGEIDELLKDYVDGVIKNRNKKLTPVWSIAFDAILDTYFGKVPESFEYEGKEYSPKTFAEKFVPLKSEDYVSLTSYTHHPFYSSFLLEIPDNWLWKESFNLPLDELTEVFHSALEKGYTIAWGGDVSEKGFSHKNGVAIVPIDDIEEMDNSERSKWEKVDKKDFYSFKSPVPEKVITQDMRQIAFDNYETTDDHGMHIVGLYKDQHGTFYYKVKNSWNTDSKYDGYLFMSESFARYKTMNIVVNKNAIPKEIRKKLGI